ncbi:hypothetical protein HYV57_04370 [Candidatus Peregrinibacteria bacterium]|nr:hypothetical protein [Candidatus Peregrinibacteria bacterium]
MTLSSFYNRTHCALENSLRRNPLCDRIEAHFERIEEILQKNCLQKNHCDLIDRRTSLFPNNRCFNEDCHVNHRGNRRHPHQENSRQTSFIEKSYSAFLIWIYIWDIMKLMKMSSAGEVLKNIWIEKINRVQGRISQEIRTHRGIRNDIRSIRLPFHIQGRG